MQPKRNTKETGNVLLCVLGTILIVSLIAATVLNNSTTRLNASSNQVRAWKEALSAAETGGDIAYAEIRKSVSTDPLIKASQWVGWTNPAPGRGWTTSGTYTYVSPEATFGDHEPTLKLRAQTVVEKCYFDHATKVLTPWDPVRATGNPWYRLRSKGTAPLPNLKRTGMDDALTNDGLTHFAAFGSTAMQDITARSKGDSLLRKIDFNTDHFIATYGPNGDGLNKALVAPSYAPSISRRIEQIVTPVTPFFDAAIKCAGSFRGLGDAAMLDSYDSRNGPYYFCANNPADPHFIDSRHGSLEIGSATATIRGMLYGDVATNGGNIVRSAQITGTIDNNVPFTLDDYRPDTSVWPYQPPGNNPNQLPAAGVTSPKTLTPLVAGTSDAPVYYLTSSISNALTVNPAMALTGNPPVLAPVATYVAIHVTGDISGGSAGITVNPKVHLKIYFDGNISVKNSSIVNQSPADSWPGPLANPYAGNLQFYGISPPPGTTQTINLLAGAPTTLYATFYAPGADVSENGNPGFTGTMVCKSFYSNGTISWHYDRALNDDGQLIDFRIASYVEDTR